MKKIILSTVAIMTIAGSAMASESHEIHLTDTVKSELTHMLEADGYSVGKIKTEDGLYEVYAKKDGNLLEIFFDSEYHVVKVEGDHDGYFMDELSHLEYDAGH